MWRNVTVSQQTEEVESMLGHSSKQLTNINPTLAQYRMRFWDNILHILSIYTQGLSAMLV